VLNVFAVETGRIEKRGNGFVERDPMFKPIAFRFAGIPVEHLNMYIQYIGLIQLVSMTQAEAQIGSFVSN